MYQFIIPNKKLVYYQVFAYAIIILNILGLYRFGLQYAAYQFNIIPISVGTLLIIFWDLFRYKKKKILQSLGILILLCGAFWMSRGVTWMLFFNVILWGLYSISKRKLEIAVDESFIYYPSFPEKKISWNAVSNIILKDDILTIDLKNNKIYQHLIHYPKNEVNEAEFNEFCKQKLKSEN